MSASSLIGQTIKIGEYTVTIKSKIGEGGYAWIYRAEDANGNIYALKYVNCLTPERFNQFQQEANVLKSIPPHPNIIKLFASDMNQKTFVIRFLFEYCPSDAIKFLESNEPTTTQILIFFAAVAEATSFLHSQDPPIIHRDLKPENILISTDGTPKLCDFGSATTTIYQISKPDQIAAAEEDIERNTTPNYRAPEMIDLYKRQIVGPPADIWALGCTLFKLATKRDLYRPEDRLAILQGKVNLPPNMDTNIAAMIRGMLKPDPSKRPHAYAVAGASAKMRGPIDKLDPPTIPQVVSNPQPTLLDQVMKPKSDRQSKNDRPVKNSKEEGSQNSQGSLTQGAFPKWQWLQGLQDTAREFVSTGQEKWAIQATEANDEAPDCNATRQLLLGSIRKISFGPVGLADFLLKSRPIKTDSRVAAKGLYLLLLLSQYENDFSPLIKLTIFADQIVTFWSGNTNYEKVINLLAQTLRLKLILHGAHSELEGSLSYGKSQPSNGLKDDLFRYLGNLLKIGESMLRLASSGFIFVVISQPVISEISAVYELERSLTNNQMDVALKEKAESLFEKAMSLPYLSTSVNYPGKDPKMPHSRFVPQ